MIVSASRRTDLPRCYPGLMAGWIRQGYVRVPNPFNRIERTVSLAPEDVHTLVLWSKDFGPLLADQDGLRSAISAYDQLFFHLTITGLGGTAWEPDVPPPDLVAQQFRPLAALAGDPRRIQWRFDPVVFWRQAGRVESNLAWFERIAVRAREAGVARVTVSLCQWYAKSRRRADRQGLRWFPPRKHSTERLARWLLAAGGRRGLAVEACCSPALTAAGIPAGHCIDAGLLSRLHPRGLQAETRKDPGQRRDCGCSVSADIGSYDLACPSGCRYCYANPKDV